MVSDQLVHRRRRIVATGALSITLLMVALLVRSACQSIDATAPPDETVPTAGSTYENPVLNADTPDPSVVLDGASRKFLIFSTAPRAGSFRIPVIGTADFRNWDTPTEAMPSGPAWATAALERFWAPDVTRAPTGGWRLFFTAQDARSGRQCIGVALAPRPRGPYVSTSTPLACPTQAGGAIDPSVYTSRGKHWLIYKVDGNCCALPSQIRSIALSADLLATVGTDQLLLEVSEPWQRWKGSTISPRSTIEGPAMISVAGRTYLIYSGNGWDSADYAVGVAVCAGPRGPCQETRSLPVLSATGDVAGPGGASPFQDGAGNWYLAYHGWNSCCVGYSSGGRRALFIDALEFTGSSIVVVGPTNVPMPSPVP